MAALLLFVAGVDLGTSHNIREHILLPIARKATLKSLCC